VIDARDDDGRTSLASLRMAVQRGKNEVARLFLEHSADVNARDELGKTPSQYTDQQEILQLLSEYGAESIK
jgi:ankyrin repeat protein